MATYRLRWRFDRAGCPPKYGIWSPTVSNNPEDQAWSQNKEGLVRASIEGKDEETKEIRCLAECRGEDYMNFQWRAVASISPMGLKGPVTLPGRVIGLWMLTRDEQIEVYTNGQVVRGPNKQKNIQFATFGK